MAITSKSTSSNITIAAHLNKVYKCIIFIDPSLGCTLFSQYFLFYQILGLLTSM